MTSASVASSYIPIHPSHASTSTSVNASAMSTNESDFLTYIGSSADDSTMRVDGRRLDELRPCRIELHRTPSCSGASCTVQWGTGGGAGGGITVVHCAMEADLVVPPVPDRTPSEGILQISVDLSCGASPFFRHAPPVTNFGGSSAGGGIGSGGAMEPSQKFMANRILRSLERLLLGAEALDVESLVVVPSRWVWRLQIGLGVLDASGGNLLDASVLACWACLRHYRKPHVRVHHESNGGGSNSGGLLLLPTLIPPEWKDPEPLPLHHFPLTASFAVLPSVAPASRSASKTATVMATATTTTRRRNHNRRTVSLLVDPGPGEEAVSSGYLTVGLNPHGEILLLDCAGGTSKSSSVVSRMSLTTGSGSGHAIATGSGPSRFFAVGFGDSCCELSSEDLRDGCQLASTVLTPLFRQLEDDLAKADEEWKRERLRRLIQTQREYEPEQQQKKEGSEIQVPVGATDRAAEQMEEDEDGNEARLVDPRTTSVSGASTTVAVKASASADAASEAEIRADEMYRMRALDYNLGHTPIAVRENNHREGMLSQQALPPTSSSSLASNSRSPSALLAFLLESAQKGAVVPHQPPSSSSYDTVRQKIPELPPPPPVQHRSPPIERPGTKKTTMTSLSSDPFAMSDDEDAGERNAASAQLRSEFLLVDKNAETAARAGKKGDDDKTNSDGSGDDDLAAAIKPKQSKKKHKSKKR